MDIVIVIEGKRAAWPEHLSEVLADPAAGLAALDSSRHVQMPLTALIAREAGVTLSLMVPTGSVPPALLIAV
jgi:Histidine phosphotransferase C-terminal domain